MVRRKNIIIIIMIITVMLMGTSYAILSTQLNINGSTAVTSTWKVEFSEIRTTKQKGGATNKVNPSYTATTVNFQVDLVQPGDEITYEIDITNHGDIKAEIKGASYDITGSEAIYVEVEGIRKGTTIESCEGLSTCPKVTAIIRVGYDEMVTKDPSSKTKNIKITLNIGQYVASNPTPDGELIPELKTTLIRKILNDNEAQSDENIDFSNPSSETNGKGLYYTNVNTEENKRTYYFRGEVENNYVSFAGHLWKIVRINEDSSIRLIKQGKIGNANFNALMGDNAYVGYMYGHFTTYKDGLGIRNSTNPWTRQEITSTVKMSTTYTFNSSTGEYTLTGTIVNGNYTSEYYNYYTCMGQAVTCNQMVKITDTVTNNGYHEIRGAEVHTAYFSETYEEAHKNEENSTMKTYLDNWYKNNLLSYSSYIEDSGFCNDRSLYTGEGYGKQTSYYGPYKRLVVSKTLQFKCPNEEQDLFTTSTSNKGNKTLTYPIGLITADEVAYAGGAYGSNRPNHNYYLYTGGTFWTMSSYSALNTDFSITMWNVHATGYLYGDRGYYGYAVYPVINLKPTVEMISGSGTFSSPYLVKTS